MSPSFTSPEESSSEPLGFCHTKVCWRRRRPLVPGCLWPTPAMLWDVLVILLTSAGSCRIPASPPGAHSDCLQVYIKFHCRIPLSCLWDFRFAQPTVSLLCHSWSCGRGRMAPQAALSYFYAWMVTRLLSWSERKRGIWFSICFSISKHSWALSFSSPWPGEPGRVQSCSFFHGPIPFFFPLLLLMYI